jgi:hypothetical protein
MAKPSPGQYEEKDGLGAGNLGKGLDSKASELGSIQARMDIPMRGDLQGQRARHSVSVRRAHLARGQRHPTESNVIAASWNGTPRYLGFHSSPGFWAPMTSSYGNAAGISATDLWTRRDGLFGSATVSAPSLFYQSGPRRRNFATTRIRCTFGYGCDNRLYQISFDNFHHTSQQRSRKRRNRKGSAPGTHRKYSA